MDLFDDRVKRGKTVNRKGLSRSSSGSSSGSGNNSKPNELINKVASNIKGNNPAGSMDYITRNSASYDEEQFIEPFNEMDEYLNKEELEELKKEWKEEFSDPKKINTRNMTHFVISIDVPQNESNLEKFESAIKGYLKERFADEGFRYIATLHTDTDKPHYHVLVNNNNLETQKKLRIDINWHYESREMIREYLKQNGIEQAATFKKDRQMVKSMSNEFEKEYTNVSNWFDAKLKTASRNNEHFKQLQKQWDVLNAVKQDLSAQDASQDHERFTTQKQVEVSTLIKQLKQDMTTYEHYNSRTAANKAVSDIVKAANPQRSTVQKALNMSDKRTEQELANQKRQNYFLAKELVRGESILRESKDVTDRQKAPILKHIAEQKANFQSQGIDVKKMERELAAQMSQNPKLTKAVNALNRIESAIDRQERKDGQIDVAQAEKRIVRILNDMHSANKVPLSKEEQKLLDESKSQAFKSLDEKGINTKQIEEQWKAARQLKDQVQELNKTIKKQPVIDAHELDKSQAILNKLNDQLQKNPPQQLSQKERNSIGVTLARTQEMINERSKNDFQRLDKETQALAKNLDSLTKKVAARETGKVQQQTFMMVKKQIEIERTLASKKVTPSQIEVIQKRLEQFNKVLTSLGVQSQSIKDKLLRTEQAHSQAKQLGAITMERARANGFDKTLSAIDKTQAEIKVSTLPRDEKRTVAKELMSKSNDISKTIISDRDKLEHNLIKIKELLTRIETLSDIKSNKNLTHLERLNNNRAVNDIKSDITNIYESSKKMLGTSVTKSLQTQYSNELKSAQQISINHSINRAR